jgi:subtilisin family serine protease
VGLSFFLCACHDSADTLVGGMSTKSIPLKTPYEPGVVLVKFKTGKNPAVHDPEFHKELGVERTPKPNRTGVEHMRLLTSESVEQAVLRLRQDPRIEYAEPNWKIGLLKMPDDEWFGECWGLHNTGQNGGTLDADIDAPEAWDLSIGSHDVVVAVADTGVDYTHPDLVANIWMNADEIAGNGLDDDGNSYVDDVYGWNFKNENNDPMDMSGHGTHCSGTIGAEGNNNLGVTGVNWHVSILSVRITDEEGEASGFCLDAAQGIRYAVDNGARAINCSWWTSGYYSRTLEDAVVYARDHGVILVVAAGNDAADNDDPASNVWPANWPYDNIITVAATNRLDRLAEFSNFGLTTVDVGAPGEEIFSTIWPDKGYQLFSGTSTAAPYVVGVIALMLSLNPDLSPVQVKQTLISTVDPIPDLLDKTVSGGRINAFRALQAVSGVPLPPVALATGPKNVRVGTRVTLDGSRSFDPNQDPITYEWTFLAPMESVEGLSDATSMNPRFTADACGLYQAILSVTDTGGLKSEPDQVQVTSTNQDPPEQPVESPHPYPSLYRNTWTIHRPGATTLGVHFSSFDTEARFDIVRILDGSDQEVAEYSGSLGAFDSAMAQGETLKIAFAADESKEAQGFVVDTVFWCDAGRCPQGKKDCNQDPSDGCETDVAQDQNNCGHCGTVCEPTLSCRNAICVCPDDDQDAFQALPCGSDCNDGDSAIHPDMLEVCDDDVDNNCDGLTDSQDQAACPETEESVGCGCQAIPAGDVSSAVFMGAAIAFLRRRDKRMKTTPT